MRWMIFPFARKALRSLLVMSSKERCVDSKIALKGSLSCYSHPQVFSRQFNKPVCVINHTRHRNSPNLRRHPKNITAATRAWLSVIRTGFGPTESGPSNPFPPKLGRTWSPTALSPMIFQTPVGLGGFCWTLSLGRGFDGGTSSPLWSLQISSNERGHCAFPCSR